MRVAVADIRKSTGLSKRFDFEGKLEISGLPLQGQLKVALKLTNAGSRILVEGPLSAEVGLECSRCAEAYKERVKTEIDESFVHADSEEARLAPRGSIDEVFTYESDKVELEELLRQELQAALPMQAVCQVDCKGLCSGCGVNLNTGSCQCRQEEMDPRWSALLNLKDNKAIEKRRKDRPGR